MRVSTKSKQGFFHSTKTLSAAFKVHHFQKLGCNGEHTGSDKPAIQATKREYGCTFQIYLSKMKPGRFTDTATQKRRHKKVQ